MAESTTQTSAELYYPVTKMNFVVSVDGLSDSSAAFMEVTGIDASVDVIEFRQGNSSSLAPVKLPGLVKHGNLTLKMGYVNGSGFKTWIQECISERRGPCPRHNVIVELIDIRDGSPQQTQTEPNQNKAAGPTDTIQWTFTNAWVCKYTGADMNASASEVAVESVEIAFEEMIVAD